jgi:two-component system response regulator
MENKVRSIDILLVEDSPDDVILTREAFAESKILNELYVVEDGVEAMKFLNREEEYEQVPIPDLILLDLNLPKKSGIEVLEEIKNQEKLKKIPVVVLTTSKAEEDIIRSYDLHANCYITKPVDLDKFINIVKSLTDFWFSVVTLPGGE